ncbi:DUF2797 domain-containing protein [Salinimonas sp. HHU 13199]|uniref:DUF2797 domain-containing protein n=1 Tax=Salinimonas profundi TaxID=2729140 RepID=A0ABR8LDK9_9ALTE|nr:DUF2797 domain-containing protein [Salinimonas profundi]MBD3584372.1 DUF2797 domain-containing protein [Salinimonas profundi]
MPSLTGNIAKMRVSATPDDNTVQYSLPVGDQLVEMNALIGSEVEVSHSGLIHCVHCGSKTKKSFNQGYCYRCLITLAQCDSCIIKPEKCHYHEGTCREPEWGEAHCMSDHFVYLANTGNLKVGITRHVKDSISSRWMDQGASQALVMLRVPDRLTSGQVETLFKAHIADKTNWRTMLKGAPDKQDLEAEKQRLLAELQPELDKLREEKGLQAISETDSSAVDIDYPVTAYPDKIKSINLDKTPSFSGTLQGIKGQYWLLDGNRVINMRKYAGYELTVSY